MPSPCLPPDSRGSLQRVRLSRWIVWGAGVLLLGGCITAPAYPLPEPLPETLEWARSGADGGAFLGLEVRENDSDSLEDLFFEPGVRVTRVVENSPAEAANFQVGDIVLSFDDQPIDDPGALATLLERMQSSGEVILRAQRGDSTFDIPVTLAVKSAETARAELVWRSDPVRTRAGWLTGRGGAVLVTRDPIGPVARAEIEVGSVVSTLDGAPILSARALIRAVQALPPGAEVECGFTDPKGVPGTATIALLEAPRRVLEAGLPFLLEYDASPDGTHVSLAVLDWWLIWLVRYEREGEERRWSFLRFFTVSTGVGELGQ